MTLAAHACGGAGGHAHPALRLGWTVALLVYGAAAGWLVLHPAALPSDDALFFSRGLVRFSILDFSPQFPGYPGFVAMGRLLIPLAGDPVRALFALTVTVALALPPAAALVAWRLGADGARALAAFVLTLTCPLLPDLALNLLSDGAGILFILLALAALASNETPGWRAVFVAGLALGWAACCRPSDGILVAGMSAAVAWRLPRRLPSLAVGMALVGLPVLGVLYALEGDLYFWAGLHFVAGHTMDWGNTLFSRGESAAGWAGEGAAAPLALVIAAIILGATLAVVRSARPVPVAVLAAALAMVGHTLWVLVMQNPDHLRHLAPMAILGGLLVAVLDRPTGRAGWRLVAASLLGFNVAALAPAISVDPGRAPPLEQAAGFLSRPSRGGVLVLNDGVALMRSRLKNRRVHDLQAPGTAALAIRSAGGGYRLSTSKQPGPAIAMFRGRWPGERTQYLYRIAHGDIEPEPG